MRLSLIVISEWEGECFRDEQIRVSMMRVEFDADLLDSSRVDQGELEVLIILHIVGINVWCVLKEDYVVVLVMRHNEFVVQIA